MTGDCEATADKVFVVSMDESAWDPTSEEGVSGVARTNRTMVILNTGANTTDIDVLENIGSSLIPCLQYHLHICHLDAAVQLASHHVCNGCYARSLVSGRSTASFSRFHTGYWFPLRAPSGYSAEQVSAYLTTFHLTPLTGTTSRIPQRLTGFSPRWGRPRFFARGNRDRRGRWSAGFLGDLPFPTSLHSGIPYSPRFTLIGSQVLDRLKRISPLAMGDSIRNSTSLLPKLWPNIYSHSIVHSHNDDVFGDQKIRAVVHRISRAKVPTSVNPQHHWQNWGRGWMILTRAHLDSLPAEPGSTPGSSHVGIAPVDAAGRRGFSRRAPVSPALAFHRCSILTSLHPRRFSKTSLLWPLFSGSFILGRWVTRDGAMTSEGLHLHQSAYSCPEGHRLVQGNCRQAFRRTSEKSHCPRTTSDILR
ncbi:hypothetical protein PR048_031252 [Dryococelus australis]|uniref:Uncharacterized protein n=1 Tax=Dryococelus australis TaxID=614101 RepID=A0ABQ9G4R2_9NEOP|nr:hypothetical protein PR048_031252 [Dryococelus australis]